MTAYSGNDPGWWVDGVRIGTGPQAPPRGAGSAHAPPWTAPAAAGGGPPRPAGGPPYRARRWPAIVTAAVLLVVVGIALVVDLAALGHGPRYRVAIPPSTLPGSNGQFDVAYVVRNVGTSGGTPTCTIQATTPIGRKSGTTVVTQGAPLAAHRARLYVTPINDTSTSTKPITGRDIEISCS